MHPTWSWKPKGCGVGSHRPFSQCIKTPVLAGEEDASLRLILVMINWVTRTTGNHWMVASVWHHCGISVAVIRLPLNSVTSVFASMWHQCGSCEWQPLQFSRILHFRLLQIPYWWWWWWWRPWWCWRWLWWSCDDNALPQWQPPGYVSASRCWLTPPTSKTSLGIPKIILPAFMNTLDQVCILEESSEHRQEQNY